MSNVSGVNPNFNYQYQDTLSQPMNIDTLGGVNNDPINFMAREKEADEKRVDNVKDGKDDGHIGFWRGLGHFLKGATINFVGGLLGFDADGNWHLGQFLTNAAVIAGAVALTIATGGAATPFLIAAGIGMAGVSMADGAYRIMTAETDAECEAAFEQFGTGTTAMALALIGGRSYQKGVATENIAAETAAKVDAGEILAEDAADYAAGKIASMEKDYSGLGIFKANKDMIVDAGKTTVDYAKNTYTAITEEAGEGAGFVDKAVATKNVLGEQYSNFKANARANYEQTVYGAKDKIASDVDKINNEIAELDGEIAKVKDTDLAKTAELEAKKSQLNAKRDGYNEVNGCANSEDAQAVVKNTRKALSDAKKALKEAKNDSNKTPKEYADAKRTVQNLETKLKAQVDALARKELEARAIQNRIDATEKKIAKLEKKNPSAKTQAKLTAEKTKLYDLNDSKLVADYELSADPFVKGMSKVNTTANYAKAAYEDPATRWMTLSYGAEKFYTTREARMMSMLPVEQRRYVASVPKEQREAMVEEFYRIYPQYA